MNTIAIQYLNNEGTGFADWVNDVAAGTTLSQFLASRGVNDPRRYTITVNGAVAAATTILADRDRVSVTPSKVAGAIS